MTARKKDMEYWMSLVGTKFGKITLLKFSHTQDSRKYYECLCDCGNQFVFCIKNLKNGSVTSCGCVQAEINIRRNQGTIGRKFGRLTVLRYSGIKKRLHFFECICDCGKTCYRDYFNLIDGRVKSCGCLKREMLSAKRQENKESATKEYLALVGMKTRCYRKQATSYADYGGRGIKICDRWLESYGNFLADMGRAPTKKHTVERKDVNGNYEPSNCIWATVKEQSNNRRNTIFIDFNGRTQSLANWCDELGVSMRTVRQRLQRYKWSVEESFTKPSQRIHK